MTTTPEPAISFDDLIPAPAPALPEPCQAAIEAAPAWADEGFMLMLSARNGAPADEENARAQQSADAYTSATAARCEQMAADLGLTLGQTNDFAHRLSERMQTRMDVLVATVDTPGPHVIPAEVAARMLDMAVDGITAYADAAFLGISKTQDQVLTRTLTPAEAKRTIARIVAQLRRQAAGAADRIADYSGWDDVTRADLHRRRNEIYDARIAALRATTAPGGHA